MPSYADHISEVFIKPIRSVLAVDDRFPTLDALVSKDAKHSYDENSERLAKLLQFCRTENPEWLVDVHDGRGIGSPDSPLATMRQCSWLILDYKLDGESGDGSRSISALRSLAGSDHFNLVAIYTADKGDTVFREVALALSNLATLVPLNPEERIRVEKALTEWEDSEPKIVELIGKQISGSACFELLQNKNASVKNGKNGQILAEFNRLAQEGIEKCGMDTQLLLNYFVLKHLSSVIPDAAKTFPVELSPPSSERRWIYARNIFVSIEEKTMDPAQLLDALMAALREWRPSPNQLIIAKVRAELEASGMILDREVVKDRNLQAFWLHRLLNADPREEAHYVGSLVDRQSEILGDRLRSKLIDFTASVISNLKAEGDSVAVTKQYLGIDPSIPSHRVPGIIAHNTHVSTKPASGKNLTAGHVLRIPEETKTSIWICLSPACDLEAGRAEGRDLKVHLHPWMPVTVVKLHKITAAVALKFATRGWVLFLDMGGAKEQFSYFSDADAKNSPVWEEIFAKDEGRLLNGNEITIARIRKSAIENCPPSFKEFGATLVGQLRSEYVASLTQRFTAHLSRIGLDYYGSD